MLNEYLIYLDELTHKERSIWLYHFCLKVPSKETATRLNLSLQYVRKTIKQIQFEMDNRSLKEEILEAFLID